MSPLRRVAGVLLTGAFLVWLPPADAGTAERTALWPPHLPLARSALPCGAGEGTIGVPGCLTIPRPERDLMAPPGTAPEIDDSTLRSPAVLSSDRPRTDDRASAGGLTAERGREAPYSRRSLFVRIWKDQGPLATSWWPAECARQGFAAPMAATVLVAATSDAGKYGGLDVQMEDWIDDACEGTCADIANTLTTLGNGPVVAAGLGTAWLAARWSGNARLEETASLAGEALVVSGIWNEAFKYALSRVRPVGGSHGAFFQYGDLPPGQEARSFPSGHAQAAFTVATVFSHAYRDERWVPWVAYGSASLIALARVGLGRHFPSDVAAGALLGNSIGRFVIARSRDGRDGVPRSGSGACPDAASSGSSAAPRSGRWAHACRGRPTLSLLQARVSHDGAQVLFALRW